VKLNAVAARRAALARTLALVCSALALLGLAAAALLGPVALALSGVAGALGALCVLAHDHFRRHELALLTDRARRDPLTGLLNRRGFEEGFDAELERARRSGSSLSVVVGDLDRFKRVNDALGHPAGDAALVRSARILTSGKRRFDSAARIGGDEFALLAADSDDHGAYVLAERVRGVLHDEFASDRPALTISFGVATFPLHGQSADSLLRAADQALYAAKTLGSDRTVISSAEVPGILERGHGGGGNGAVGLDALLSLAEALDVRETGSATHCRRVGRLAELTARELGLAPDAVERVRLAGILHDVGRVALPDALLKKSGPLTDDEWALVRSHPEVGARMVATTRHDDISSWVLLHHERPDGRGYPEGRRAGNVPLEAAIVGVADAYEAMTSERPHRPALDAEAAAAELRGHAGSQFPAEVVEALLRAV
jgi:diguanylate cyclase (GGDEF)-like protein/putative nucleotidyltransferase with HDIG domain